MVRHFATDDDTVTALPSPYLGVLKFGKDGRRGYQIPKCGNLQLVSDRSTQIGCHSLHISHQGALLALFYICVSYVGLYKL